MNFERLKRNEEGKLATLEETVDRFSSAISRLDLKVQMRMTEISPTLFFARLECPEIRFGCNGKGTSQLAAEASALGEFIERISANLTIGGFKFPPFKQFWDWQADTLRMFNDCSHMERSRVSHEDHVIAPLRIQELLKGRGFSDEDIQYVKDASEKTKVWVDAWSFKKSGYVSAPVNFITWISASNGLAAGNTMEEAILHGVNEVFERYRQINFLKKGWAPTLDHMALGPLREQVKFFETLGIEVTVKDLTGHHGEFPVYGMIFTNHNMDQYRESGRIPLGWEVLKVGSSLANTDEALQRCMTEYVQGNSLETLVKPPFPGYAEEKNDFLDQFIRGRVSINLARHKYGGPNLYMRLPFVCKDTKEELDKALDIVDNLGSDIVVIDHTHPIMRVPVVRVVVPGVSDFIEYWSDGSRNANFLANVYPEEQAYEKAIFKLMKSFWG